LGWFVCFDLMIVNMHGPICCRTADVLLQPADLTILDTAAWTIFAAKALPKPANAAFNSSTIKDKIGLRAAQLLEPANKDI
jgi:hypothetical protein